jgi:hypothetical protein
MKNSAQLLFSLILFIVLVNLSACGYKPSSKYAREVLGNKLSTSIVISATDPENSVLIKDSVDAAIISIFHASLVDKRHADTHLSLNVSEPSYSALQYDINGYIVTYRATITLHILRESKNIKKKYTTKGTYDFSVTPNAVLTDQERFDAIKFSAQKAIAAFVAKVSAEGSRI